MQLGDKEARTAKKWESAQLGLSSSTASKFWAEATSSHWTQISRKLQQSWIWPRGDVIYLLAVLLCSSLWSTQRTLEVLKDLQKLFQEGLLLEVCGGFHVYVCRVCVCVCDWFFTCWTQHCFHQGCEREEMGARCAPRIFPSSRSWREIGFFEAHRHLETIGEKGRFKFEAAVMRFHRCS